MDVSNDMRPLSHAVACVATDGFEYSELVEPKKALEAAGATVHILSPETEIRGMKGHEWHGDALPVDKNITEAAPEEYDALLLPGGVANPDALRMNDDVVKFVTHFVDTDKPIAAICHGPWTLINAGGAEGRTMTSWPSLQIDLENAGADWVDEEVVTDGNLVTSRKPDDLPAFNRAFLAILEEQEGDHPWTAPSSIIASSRTRSSSFSSSLLIRRV